eukprot:343787_1
MEKEASFIDGEVNCNVQLPSVIDELGDALWRDHIVLNGFIRDLDVKGQCGVIEIVSNHACYEPVFFWFTDVVLEDSSLLKVSSVVQFTAAINTHSYLYSLQSKQKQKWNTDPRSYLTVKAV